MAGNASNGAAATRERVRWYQTILWAAFGYRDLEINGNHNDPATKAAMRHVQRQLDLEKQNGFLTVASNAALTQAALGVIYRDPPPKLEGKFSAKLKEAIKRFQRDNDLEDDGKVGKITRGRMNAILRGLHPGPVRNFHPALAMPKNPFPLVLPPPLWGPSTRRETAAPPPTPPGTRERVEHNVDAPFRWICEVSVKVPSMETDGHGSGLLISPRHVLTAAHNLYGNFNSNDANLIAEESTRVTIIPARDRRPARERDFHNRPYGTHTTKARFYDPRWESLYSDGILTGRDDDYDFAVLTLRRAIGTGPKAPRRKSRRDKPMSNPPDYGYWGFRNVERIAALIDDDFETTKSAAAKNIARLSGRDVFICGYPGGLGIQILGTGRLTDPPVETAMRNRFRAEAIKGDSNPDPSFKRASRLYQHNIEMGSTGERAKGSSGSPVWVQAGARHVRTLIGVHVKHHGLVALTSSVLSQIAEQFPETFQTYVLNAPGGDKVRGLRVRDPG